MKIYPTCVAMDGIKEIEIGNNKGIKFTREPNPELAKQIDAILEERKLYHTCKYCGHSGPDVHESIFQGTVTFVCDSFVACVGRMKENFLNEMSRERNNPMALEREEDNRFEDARD